MIINIKNTRIVSSSVLRYSRQSCSNDKYIVEFYLADGSTYRTDPSSLEEVDLLLDKIDSGITLNRNIKV